MKKSFHLLLLSLLALIPHAQGALDFLVLESTKPGAILIVFATEGDAAAVIH